MDTWTQSENLEISPLCLNILIFQDQPLILESIRQDFRRVNHNLPNQWKRPFTELRLTGLARPGSSYTVSHSNISVVAKSRLSRHTLVYISTTLSKLLQNVLSSQRSKNPALSLAWHTVFLRCYSRFEGEKRVYLKSFVGKTEAWPFKSKQTSSCLFLVLISYSVIDSSKTILHRWTPLTLLTDTAGCICVYINKVCVQACTHTHF